VIGAEACNNTQTYTQMCTSIQWKITNEKNFLLKDTCVYVCMSHLTRKRNARITNKRWTLKQRIKN
jgi:hypothetical protein